MSRKMSSWRCHALATVLGMLAMTSRVYADVNLSPASTSATASSLSHTLSPSYIGMGIEPSNLFAFVGTSSPNTLTDNLLSNLANYTGIPPHIRVGGNTQDFMVYQSSYNGYYFGNNPGYSSQSNEYVFGPKYFSAINNLPANTPVSLGIGMTYNGSDAIDMAVAIAQQAIATLKNVNLVGFEVGNEPDLYIQNQFRPAGWTITDYGNEWIARVQAIYNQALKPNNIGTAFFEAACTATTARFQDYRIQSLVGTSLATENGVYLAGWNQHDYYYYVGVSPYQLSLSRLLDLSTTSVQFTEWASQAQAAAVTGKPYYVREMGAVGPNGLQGISNTFGNALWTLNFFLYAATVGVDSVQMHMLQSSYGSPWQPITDPDNQSTFVRPSYYAFAAMNQIIGAKCATTVAQISLSNTPGNYNNRLGAYAAYDNGKLQSLILLNTQLAYYSQSNIPSQTFVISLPDLIGKTFYLSQLYASGADATSNITWNGISYEQSGNGRPRTVSSTTQTATVGSDGTLRISVRDSQAIVANLNSVLGSQNNVVDTAACQKLAASSAEGGATSTSSTKGAAPTFKSTTGFKGNGMLSLGAIIGIAAGGGAALLTLIILICICCIRRRRSRRRRQKELDAAALLTPHQYRAQHGKFASNYANVSQRDSMDSTPTDDIWMKSVNGKQSGSLYDGSTLKNHSRHTSYNASLTGSPIRPSTPSMPAAVMPSTPPGLITDYSNSRASEMRSYTDAGAAGAAGAALPASLLAANHRRTLQNAPINSSNLVRNVKSAASPEDENYRRRERHASAPNRPPAAATAPPPTATMGDVFEDYRGRRISTPQRPTSHQQGQPRSRSSTEEAAAAAMMASAAYRRPPSGQMSRSAATSREQSPARGGIGLPRATQSSHGHGYSSRRGEDFFDNVPPVPSLPPSSMSQGHGGYRHSFQGERSSPAVPSPPPMPAFMHHANQVVAGPRHHSTPPIEYQQSQQQWQQYQQQRQSLQHHSTPSPYRASPQQHHTPSRGTMHQRYDNDTPPRQSMQETRNYSHDMQYPHSYHGHSSSNSNQGPYASHPQQQHQLYDRSDYRSSQPHHDHSRYQGQ